MAIGDELGHGRTCNYSYCDEEEDSDSSFYGTHSNCATTSSTYSGKTSNSWYFTNDSLGCIAPGTAVRLTEPGQIIPVVQWDDVERILSENVRRETATEARIAHDAALQRTQAAMEQNVARSLTSERNVSIYAQQRAVLTQQDLQRAAEQISGFRSMEMGVPQRSPVSQAEQRLQAERQQQAMPDRELGRLYGSRHEILHDEDPRRNRQGVCCQENTEQHMYRQDTPLGGAFPARESEPPVCFESMIPPRPTPPTDYLAHEKKREKAEGRAQELLGYMIGEKHLEVYKRTGRLFVKGKKHDYIIQKDGYILQLKENKVIDLCVHLEKRYAMPLTDNVIAMKLSIENEEKKVLKLANKWGERNREIYALPECAGMV